LAYASGMVPLVKRGAFPLRSANDTDGNNHPDENSPCNNAQGLGKVA
jgi:hypothetical protein